MIVRIINNNIYNTYCLADKEKLFHVKCPFHLPCRIIMLTWENIYIYVYFYNTIISLFVSGIARHILVELVVVMLNCV